MMSPKNKSNSIIKLVIMVHEGGSHTNLKAIQEAIVNGKINAEISAIIPDNEDAMPMLKKILPDYVCLAGWKKIIPDELLKKYENKILNIHPGLIPDTIDGIVKNPDNSYALWNKGMYGSKAILNFLDKKSAFAGSSVHFLTPDFDFGPVLGRVFEKIDEHDDVESLYSRLKKKENKMYVEVLEKLTSPPAPLLVKERVAEGRVRYKKILIIGAGGGREHAIGWKIAQSPRAGELFFARGNAGTGKLGVNLDIKETEIEKLLEFAKIQKINLTLALSDEPLSLGIVDEFRKAGLRIWGPTRAAAQLEWSKAFSKDFMRRHNLPTAKFEIFNNFEKAKEYVDKQPLPIVVKASGLALGKGVMICQTGGGALKALENIFVKKVFGDSGNEVVIEEFLTGPEISIHAFSDGKNYKIFPSSQDHKKIGENDTGLNTGGMGTVAPLPLVKNNLMELIEKTIVAPTLSAMAKEGASFVGVLYPGLILTSGGPKILEYNARFGDPETETYMRLLDSDILDIIDASIDQKLGKLEIKWKNISSCTIMLASGGYPEKYEKDKIISGVSEAEMQPDIVVFHAGTKINGKNLVTNGGRVLGVSATGNTMKEALEKAYRAIEKISFEGMQYRRDIGKYVPENLNHSN